MTHWTATITAQNGDVYAHLISAITEPREGAPTFTADELLHRHFPSGLLDVEDTLRAAEVVRRLKQLKCPPILSVADICLVRVTPCPRTLARTTQRIPT